MKSVLLFKDENQLRHYLSASGKILSRPHTKLKAKAQRIVKKAIKTARILGLLSFSKRDFKL